MCIAFNYGLEKSTVQMDLKYLTRIIRKFNLKCKICKCLFHPERKVRNSIF